MNTIYCPMIVDKNGQKYLCMGDIDSYYINPTDKELEKIKEFLNTAYYSLSDVEKRKYTYKIQFQYLADINLENINLIKQYGNYGIDVRCDKVTKELVKLAHENGAKVNVWNVNTNEEVDKLLRFGVDMVTSNKNFN